MRLIKLICITLRLYGNAGCISRDMGASAACFSTATDSAGADAAGASTGQRRGRAKRRRGNAQPQGAGSC